MNDHGFARISCVSLRVTVANPAANAAEILGVLERATDSDVVLFPELCVTGYTCADLFAQSSLLDAGLRAIAQITEATTGRAQLVVVGAPVPCGNRLFNCAIAISDGAVLGVVPKQYLPNYKEFYESRWFSPASGREPAEIDLGSRRVPFGIDLLFDGRPGTPGNSASALVGIEICEDLWVPIPPSSFQAIAGATVLLNPSASNETIGKSQYRGDLVVGQSGRCIAAYCLAGAGPTESTTDVVFGGQCLIAENGRLLAESPRVGDGQSFRRDSYFITQDVDVAKLLADRRVMTSFDDSVGLARPFRRVPFALSRTMEGLKREVPGTPFVPPDGPELHRRCAEIFGIQCAGLAKRLEQLPLDSSFHIGVSGGLDSTLALLVAVATCDLLKLDRRRVHGVTMPGFGTTPRTRANAVTLMEQLGVSAETIDISPLALKAFQEMGHAPFGIDCGGLNVETFRAALARVPREARQDLTFENVQARLRTFLLMSRGFVIGTGDLSELALGWSTYNGDHMSMYNPNCSIPKTLVKFLVRYVALNQFPEGPARQTLLSIVETTISPELLPASTAGEIEQSTEATLGPFELHDFILYYAVRCGYSPAKILFLSQFATFTQPYPRELCERTMRTFYTRFFRQQYKRSCVPDGPKVGTVSLSPRGDWRMPSDADVGEWLEWELP
ncbi:MAG: NAD(+) synthase [Isosphaeraceae bacterium]